MGAVASFVEDVYDAVVDVVTTVIDTVGFLITGNYEGDDGDNTAFALVFAYLCLICIIGQNRQNFKVHKNSRNIC